MSISVVFSKNKKIGSKIIAYFTKHFNKTSFPTPSHVALLINGRWICESTLEKGVHIISLEKWLKLNEIIYIHGIDVIAFSHIKAHLKQIIDKKYDYLGVIYFGLRILLNRCFKISIPQRNLWHNENKYFCTEVLTALYQEDYFDMKSPAHILSDFIKVHNNK